MFAWFFSAGRIALLFVLMQSVLTGQHLLKVNGQKIVNSSGSEVFLKGIGLGGWMLQEGYMLHTGAFASAQWQIKEKITDLIGAEKTAIFYDTWLKNYVTKADIDSLKSWGFNSVRLPFHFNLFATNTNPPQFLTKGFELTDSLLAWCEANQIYLILDMHAAPGGQSDEPISDYNSAFPSLWQSEQNKNLTVAIWRKIAERYTDKQWIGGYDLLNEPKWNLGSTNQPLRDLYIRLTDTIRAVDTNHIIFIEGNWFATDFNGLFPPWDANMVYSFHKYWNTNNQGSIQYLLDLRNNTNRPLWLGETGENSNQWLTDMAELMKTHNIGWAVWPHKKIKSVAGPLQATLSPLYQTLLNYWGGSGARPSETYAYNALMTQVNNLKIENCTYNKDYVHALLGQPFSSQTTAYAPNIIPGNIFAVNYDMGKHNTAYFDTDFQNTGGGSYNSGFLYRNDGVDIEQCSDFASNGYNVGWISNNEWLSYTVTVNTTGVYNIDLNVAAQSAGGSIFLLMNGTPLGGFIQVPATGGWQNWQTVQLSNVQLSAGTHKLTVRFYSGNFNFSNLDFVLVSTDIADGQSVPAEYALEQNYPNPFNPATKISYQLPEAASVKIEVYNALGAVVALLADEKQEAGYYTRSFEASGLASGIYFISMRAQASEGKAEYSATKKMILLK
ncbi:MAG: hypothetical protein FMNOHCHN_00487 [Ignavibacteriaceae bacterium]|nr:hypothetical protein [Ignavibacteriaceae bacterium]